MKILFLIAILSFAALANCKNNKNNNGCYPETVYLTLGDYYSPDRYDYLGGSANCTDTLQISFSTDEQCADSYIIVHAGDSEEDESPAVVAKKQQVVYQDWNGEKFCHNGKKCENVYYHRYVHYFTVDFCSFQKKFNYKIYGDLLVSKPREFQGIIPNRQSSSFVQQFLAFGDHQISKNGNYTIAKLQELVEQEDEYDGILYLGDYAYEFYNNNATKGDIYLTEMEPFYSRWPFMFSPGNHEDCYNFAFINEKFHMMNNASKHDNNVFSFNVGRVHFLSVNLHYFNNGTGVVDPTIQANMLEAVERDLIKANLNRQEQPWIITLGHKPIYCVGRIDCLDYYVQYQQFDLLFYKYGVDIFLAAHQHESTKYYPMYQNETMPYQQINQNIIINPQSYMEILQGNAGCDDMENVDEFYNATWVLSRSFDPGYGTFQIINDNLIQILNYDTKTNTTLQPTMIYSNHTYHISNKNIHSTQ